MSENRMQTIRFHGGPFDGHVDQLDLPLKPFLTIRTLAHARNVSSLAVFVRVILLHTHLEPFVLAVYELHADRSPACYRYLRSVIAAESKLDPAIVGIMAEGKDQLLAPMSPNDLR